MKEQTLLKRARDYWRGPSSSDVPELLASFAAAELKTITEERDRLREGLLEAQERDCKNRYSVACPSTPMPREEWCGRCIAVVVLESLNLVKTGSETATVGSDDLSIESETIPNSGTGKVINTGEDATPDKCPRCKTQLVSGQALQNTIVGSPDFPGDTGSEAGCTLSYSGDADLIDVMKCPDCGFSRT